MTKVGCTPLLAGCKQTCAHLQFVESYRDQRRIEEAQRDAATLQYDTEVTDYDRETPLVNFKSFLISSKGRRNQCPE